MTLRFRKRAVGLTGAGFAILLAQAGVAHADIQVLGNDKGSIDVYGIADAAVGEQTHSLSIDSQFPGSVVPVGAYKIATTPSSVTGLFNGGISPSRFGVKGDMNIGNGMKAFFTFESGVNVTTGRLSNAAGCLADNSGPGGATTDCANSSINGQLFSRQAFVGLSDEQYGSLALGRNYAPFFDIASVYDPVQNAQLFSPLGFSGTYGGGGGVSEDTRVDGSLKYSNKIDSFNFGALYKFGGVASEYTASSGFALNAGYEQGNIGIQAAYELFNDAVKGVTSSTANEVGVQIYDTKAFMIAAKYKITPAATAKIGYETYTLSAPSHGAGVLPAFTSFYGQNIAPGGINYEANYAASTTHIVFAGGDYNFTKAFNLSAGVYDIKALQSASQASGDSRYLSLLADYHITKSLDTYVGLMHSIYSGDAYPSSIYYTSNQITAAGLRFKF